MKLCKSPEEQLYQQHEHEPIRLWRSQARTQPRRCCGNGSACTQSSEEGQCFKILLCDGKDTLPNKNGRGPLITSRISTDLQLQKSNYKVKQLNIIFPPYVPELVWMPTLAIMEVKEVFPGTEMAPCWRNKWAMKRCSKCPVLLGFQQESEFKCRKPVVHKWTPAAPIPLVENVHNKEHFKGFLFSEISAWIIMSCCIFVGRGLQSTWAQTIFAGAGTAFYVLYFYS